LRTIRTERLTLVPVTPANAGALWQLLQEPDLRSYQDLPDLEREQFLRAVSARPTKFAAGTVGRFEWLLHSGDPGAEPIGWLSLRVTESNPAIAELGYSVVRQHRGKGIASESVAALIAEGFRTARLREIRAYCLPENLSSRAVLRHNDFTDEGTLTRGATVQGKQVDVIAHSLTRKRWSELTSNPPATRS
jgi:[ribosomal protein S5]-alanine N-acetyltransferase